MTSLSGVRVVEVAAIGPAPFAGMLLADMGADVVRVDRRDRRLAMGAIAADQSHGRGKRSITVDLKSPAGVDILLRLIDRADVLIEGFRPGVAERLGFGPDVCFARNRRLVFGRATGWGQDGRLSHRPGHDINYLAIAGALHPIGRAGSAPVPPVNFVANYGGGAMILAVGILAALNHAARVGEGQVVDAAMVDGARLLTSSLHEMLADGVWTDERGMNFADGGAPFYDVYETADRRFIAVGANEPESYNELLRVLGVSGESLPDQLDREGWQTLRNRFAEVIRGRTRDEWTADGGSVNACVSPVLSLREAAIHPYSTERNGFVSLDGVPQPAPAPRFSKTPSRAGVVPQQGRDTRAVLTELGLTTEAIDGLVDAGAVGQVAE
ncbi:MAG: CaiB/BaiF CoA-transferase family protein [Acidimicrobiales bacterium]